MLRLLAQVGLASLFAAESGLALQRFETRRMVFEAAERRARETGRPLVVVGDPDAGAHTKIVRAYGCGDLCVDLNGCPRCPKAQAIDLTKQQVVGVADDSAVVYCSCVLEYVDDPPTALAELRRMAGASDNLFVVYVDPHSLTAALFPHAKWSVVDPATGEMAPVTGARKLAAGGGVLGLALLAALP